MSSNVAAAFHQEPPPWLSDTFPRINTDSMDAAAAAEAMRDSIRPGKRLKSMAGVTEATKAMPAMPIAPAVPDTSAKPRQRRTKLYPHEWIGCSPGESHRCQNELGERRARNRAYREHANKLRTALEQVVATRAEKKRKKKFDHERQQQRSQEDLWEKRSLQWQQEQKQRFLQHQEEFRAQQAEQQRLQAEQRRRAEQCLDEPCFDEPRFDDQHQLLQQPPQNYYYFYEPQPQQPVQMYLQPLQSWRQHKPGDVCSW